MGEASAIIIGNRDDPHVSAVVQHGQHECIVIDARTLRSRTWNVGHDGIVIDGCEVRPGARGWVRRLAPAGSQDGLVIGSQEAAEHSAWLGLLAGIMRHPTVDWLSSFDALWRAEDKLVQYTACEKLGVPYPGTVVTSSRDGLAERFGGSVVVKPLGAGQFTDAEQSYKVVCAQLLATDDERLDKLGGAPFIVQEPIDTVTHLRVVTVGRQVAAASLPATGLALDWRSDAAAHANFSATAVPSEIAEYATRLTEELRVGFSSQDWVVDANGDAYFLDLNPAGQWLFLPADVAQPITAALAAWLDDKDVW
jgi:hypothetical protein